MGKNSILFFLILNACIASAQTTALYQPNSATVGPFPSNVVSVVDPSQQTGLHINLPGTFNTCAPGTSQSVCSNTSLLNQLDGFSVNPRIMVCFSGPVDTSTLGNGVTIQPVGKGPSIGINQIVFDAASNCAFAKPQTVLNQQSQYLLTVTDSVLDVSEARVSRDPNFTACLSATDSYCSALASALKAPGQVKKIVAASLFTTMSATTWLGEVRQYVDAHQLPIVLPAGFPYAFPISSLQSMTWIPQDNSGTNALQQDIPLSALNGVGEVAFGLFLSPNFLDPSNGTIPTIPTKSPISGPIAVPGAPALIPPGYLPVSFHAFLPSSPAPRNGYPVVIYGHGLGDNQFGASTYIASTLAKAGFATLSFEITGHGYGSGGTVQVAYKQGFTTAVSTPGRGIPINTPIGPTDGCIAAIPAIAVRDCGRQTAVDLFALVRTIQGSGGLALNLDPTRIYYVGQSFGATYGTLLLATEPSVRAAVLSGAGGTSVDVARLAISGRVLAEGYLASQGLLNGGSNGFNDSYSLRDAPVVRPVPGATAEQAAFEAADWLGLVGDPLSFAGHLSGPVLFQFGVGDLEVPNPTESAVIRAAGAAKNAWLLRFDLAVPLYPELAAITMPGAAPLPILPHRVLSNPTILSDPAEQSISLALQQQARDFLASDGKSKTDPNNLLPNGFVPNNVKLFEIPKSLPETLNYPF